MAQAHLINAGVGIKEARCWHSQSRGLSTNCGRSSLICFTISSVCCFASCRLPTISNNKSLFEHNLPYVSFRYIWVRYNRIPVEDLCLHSSSVHGVGSDDCLDFLCLLQPLTSVSYDAGFVISSIILQHSLFEDRFICLGNSTNFLFWPVVE